MAELKEVEDEMTEHMDHFVSGDHMVRLFDGKE